MDRQKKRAKEGDGIKTRWGKQGAVKKKKEKGLR